MLTVATVPDTVESLSDRNEARVPDPPPRRRRLRAALVPDHAGALLPAALVLFFSFQAGGFFPGSTGVAAGVLAVALLLRVTLGHHPFASIGAAGIAVAGSLAALAALMLVSAAWSGAPARALLEFDRALLYLLAFLLATTLPHRPARLALAVRTTAAAILAVSLVGWAGWVLPDVIEAAPGVVQDRLSEPLTYWNAQGLLAALGLLLAVHGTCARAEPRALRALAAAAAPVLASTLFFTYSRGAILAVLVALVLYVVLTRSRGLLTGGLALVPTVGMALLASYDADAFALGNGSRALRAEQGHEVAIAVGLCSLAALLLRLAADRWLERPLYRAAVPAGARTPLRLAVVLAALAVFVALPLTLGAPGYVERSFDRFVSGTATTDVDQRQRLLNPGNNGRLDHWRVAVETWRANPVLGTGAGTYATRWTQEREIGLDVQDAHSLYAEILSDLGLLGLVVLLAGLLTAVGAALRRALRRPPPGTDRSLAAVVVAVLVAWAIHAGLDWIWEMPAITAVVLALAGLALATGPATVPAAGPGRGVRVAFGIGLLVLAVIPVQVVRSQTKLNTAVDAFRASPRDCPGAIDASLASLAAIGARAEPWEIIAYCDVGQAEPQLALRAARNAVARDPDNWTYRYALALVQGVAGEDPRPAAERALELNPQSGLAQQAAVAFRAGSRRTWAQVARGLELPTG